MARRIRIALEYDGTAYAGWQIQPNAPKTIQAALEQALFELTGERGKVYAAGRTDAGVHAEHLTAAFDTDSTTISAEQFAPALTAYLPRDIAVLTSSQCADDFSPRHETMGKQYAYRILNRKRRSPLWENRAWQIGYKLDLDAMQAAADRLLGEHDFSSFRSSGCNAKHPVREIYSLRVTRLDDPPEMIEIRCFATAFLKQMVRNIVGTLLEVGRGAIAPEALNDILAARDRAAAGPCAPAWGLRLVKVYYPDDPPPEALRRLIPGHESD